MEAEEDRSEMVVSPAKQKRLFKRKQLFVEMDELRGKPRFVPRALGLTINQLTLR
jgi:hypothetical protein